MYVKYMIRHDFVKRQAVLQSSYFLQLNIFHAAAGLEDAKKDFSVPIIIPPKKTLLRY